MCSCDEGAVCSRHQFTRHDPDYFDASHDPDDPYNETPAETSPAEYEVIELG